MGEENLGKSFEILELNPDVAFSEIKSSYFHLKKLYSTETPVLSALMDDISETRRESLLMQIDDAYQTLKEHYSSKKTEKQKMTHERVQHNNIPEFEVFSGNALKLTREVLGVRLEEIALSTGIPLNHLQSIERERFDMLPPEGYIRIYVTRYAEYLSLDTKRVTMDYMKAVNKKKPHVDRNRF